MCLLHWGGVALFTLILCLGLGLRLRQYFFDRSLYQDEARLANNVVERPLGSLLTQPLEWDQVAPPGFLAALKGATWLLGESPKALRFLPLVGGVLAMLLTVALARAALRQASARFCLVGLVCFAPGLVYYSSDCKQYSTDVAFALLVLWLGARFRAERWKSGVAALALAGSISVWCSHPGVFVLAAVGPVLWLELVVRKQRAAAAALTAVGAFWLANLAVIYALWSQDSAHDSYLQGFWSAGFAPWPFGAWKSLGWYLDSGIHLMYVAFGRMGPIFVNSEACFTPLNACLLVLALAGAGSLWRGNKRLAGILSLCVVFTVVASALRLYPLRGRLILFLAPVVYLFLSGLIEWLAAHRPGSWSVVAGLGAAGLVGVALAASMSVAWRPYNRLDIKGAIAYVQARHLPGDQVALTPVSEPVYRFYVRQYGMQNIPVVATLTTNYDPGVFLETLGRKGARKRTWLIAGEWRSVLRRFLRAVRRVAPTGERWHAEEWGDAYLLDFSKAGGTR